MKIMVDGFNLALEKGTGVATYARNLTYSLHEMGHEVHVLYGMRRAVRAALNPFAPSNTSRHPFVL